MKSSSDVVPINYYYVIIATFSFFTQSALIENFPMYNIVQYFKVFESL